MIKHKAIGCMTTASVDMYNMAIEMYLRYLWIFLISFGKSFPALVSLRYLWKGEKTPAKKEEKNPSFQDLQAPVNSQWRWSAPCGQGHDSAWSPKALLGHTNKWTNKLVDFSSFWGIQGLIFRLLSISTHWSLSPRHPRNHCLFTSAKWGASGNHHREK